MDDLKKTVKKKVKKCDSTKWMSNKTNSNSTINKNSSINLNNTNNTLSNNINTQNKSEKNINNNYLSKNDKIQRDSKTLNTNIINNLLDIGNNSKPKLFLTHDDLMFVYPQQLTEKITFDINNISIFVSRRDLISLYDKNIITDNIINFYLIFLRLNILNNLEKYQFYIYHTHFFKILNSFSKSEESYENVKDFTRDVNIFKKDYLIVPIFDSFQGHDFSGLIIIRNPGENPKIFYYNTNDEIDLEKRFIKKFSSYLENEWKCKEKNSNQMEKFKDLSKNFNCFKQEVSIENKNDQYLYVLKYIDLFIRNPIINRAYINIINQDVISKMREELIKLIYQTQKEQFPTSMTLEQENKYEIKYLDSK